MLTAAATFVVNCVLSLAFMGPVARTGESRVGDAIAAVTQAIALVDLRHAGLALSTSVAATVNLVLLAVCLRRKLGGLDVRDLAPSFVRSLVASLAMVPPVLAMAALVDWSQPGRLVTRAAVLGAAVAVGIVVYGAVAMILGGDEVRAVVRLARERLTRA